MSTRIGHGRPPRVAIAVETFSLASLTDWRAPLRMRTMTTPASESSMRAVRVSGTGRISYTGLPTTPKWRNWQTHQLEGLAVAIPWGFESPLPHHVSNQQEQLRISRLCRVSCRPVVDRLLSGRTAVRSDVERHPSAVLEGRERRCRA